MFDINMAQIRLNFEDLTPLDFYLWVNVKNLLYRRRPANLDTLWDEIRTVCAEIPLQTLVTVTESVATRVQRCIDADGHHFEQLL